jgi:hypothetical protein
MAKTILETFRLNKVASVVGGEFYNQPATWEIDSDREIGIEVEVENHQWERQPKGLWVVKGDGSLRNNGAEWITNPVAARWAPQALEDLLGGTCLTKDCCFSPRTSIHVHYNVQQMSTAQVTDVVLLYTALEPLFYKFTGRGRIKNIYCVPLMDTTLITGMNYNNLSNTIESWSKYTGLNLLPIRELGTIEARHMHGTFDHKKVVTWIRMWIKLIDFCIKVGSGNIRMLCMSMGPGTDYQQLLIDIFGTDAEFFKYAGPQELRFSVNVMKRAFISGAGRESVGVLSKSSPYFKVGA